MPKGFRDTKTDSDSGKKWEDDLPFELKDIRSIAKDDYRQIRLVGYIEPFMRVWVPTEASKAYDPYKTKVKQYPSICTDFDPEDEKFVRDECLYRKAHYKYVDPDSGEERWGRLKPTKNYLIFYIDRDRQSERSGISLKKKLADPKKRSDIQCATVPTAFAREVKNAIEMYEKKTKKASDPTDSAEGFDLWFKFDNAAAAESKYNIQLGDASPLDDEELAQLELLPDGINIYPKDGPDRILESLERAGYIICERGEDPEEVLAEKKSAKKQRGAMKAGAELLDDDDEDEDEQPRKGRRRPPVEDDGFEDEDDDLGLEDEEPKKSKKQRPPVDDEDDDDEDEEPKKASKKQRPPVDDDDEDEDEEPKKKSKKTKAPASDDDDDFDFDDEDFE